MQKLFNLTTFRREFGYFNIYLWIIGLTPVPGGHFMPA
jgi:hypothetical protein